MRSLMLPVITGLLMAAVLLSETTTANAECCDSNDVENESLFCQMYSQKNAQEQAQIRLALGDNCEGKDEDRLMEKRKPNFIRFGRADFWDDKRKPTFIRFGRSPDKFFMLNGANNNDAGMSLKIKKAMKTRHYERFGRPDSETEYWGDKKKPTFLRFGRSVDTEYWGDKKKPTFLRFGKADDTEYWGDKKKPTFLRFGRTDGSECRVEKKKPNFMRFGRSVDAGDSWSDKEKVDFHRFGRGIVLVDDNEQYWGDKKKPTFLRFGRNEYWGDKKKPTFLRFGRPDDRESSYWGDKKKPGFLRFGRDDYWNEKKKPTFLRFGRNVVVGRPDERKPTFIRFGRS